MKLRCYVLAILGVITPQGFAQLQPLQRHTCGLLATGPSWPTSPRVVDVRNSKDRLYTLLDDATAGRTRLVVLSSINGYLKHIDLPQYARGLAVSETGEFAVQSPASKQGEWRLSRYDPAGKLVSSQEIGQGLPNFWINGSAIVGVRSDGRLASFENNRTQVLSTAAAATPQQYVQPVKPGLTMLIDRVSASVQLLNGDSALIGTTIMKTPEVEYMHRRQAEDINKWESLPEAQRKGKHLGSMHAVFAPSSDLKGSVFVLVSGFRPSEGATMLKIAEQGTVLGRYALSLTDTGLPSKSATPLFPAYTAVVAQALYLIEPNGIACSYALP